MGACRTSYDANRSAVRSSGAAHRYPELGGSALGTSARRIEGKELPAATLEPLRQVP